MKQLVCDVCGGKLIMDKSRQFSTCESCGLEYPIDAMKKMMTVPINTGKTIGNTYTEKSDFVIEGGVLKKYIGNKTHVIVPDEVIKIGENAFEEILCMDSIEIPINIIDIGDEAFKNCQNLKSISIPEGVERIGESAFFNCNQLTSVVIPESIKSIEFEAFKNCSNLKTINIPDGIEEISGGVFAFCSGLESIPIPSSYKEIPFNTFVGCTGLKEIAIGNHEIGLGAFRGCEGLISVEILNCVEDIGSSAFEYCTMLKTLILPEPSDHLKIGTLAFDKCKSLLNVVGLTSSNYNIAFFHDCSEQFYQNVEKQGLCRICGSNQFNIFGKCKICAKKAW